MYRDIIICYSLASYIYIYIYIYIYTQHSTPGLHNKIPAHKTFARVWVAQESILLHYQR